MKKEIFKKGDIIVFCDEEFEVIENYGSSGKVREAHGGTIINNFYWSYSGDECRLRSIIK